MRSWTLERKEVLAKSPSELPSPVKSNRRVANPLSARALEMAVAAREDLPQVKQ